MPVTEEGLRFRLSGEVEDFNKAMDSAASAAEDTAKRIFASSKVIGGSANYIDNLNKTLKDFASDVKNGQARFVAFGTAVNQNGKIVEQFAKQSSSASTTLTSFSRIVQDAPYGIIGVGNNITQLAEQMGYLIAQTGGVRAALASLQATLFGVGGIILGVSLLTTGLTLLAQRQQKQAVEAKKQKEENKDLAQVMRETTASVQGQVETTRDLGLVLLDTNKSYEQRKAALNELKKIGGDYFKGLTLEKSSYDDLKKAVDNYADSLVRTATIKGLQEQISKTAEQIAKVTPIISKATKDIAKEENPFSSFVQKIADDAGKDTIQLQGAFTRLDSVINTQGKKTAADIANVGRLQIQAVAGTAPLQELRDRLKSFTDALSEQLAGITTPDRTGGSGKTIADIFADLNNNLKAVDASFKTVNFNFDDIQSQKITLLTKAFDDLVKAGLSPADARLKDITGQVQTLATSITDITEQNAQGVREFNPAQLFTFNKKEITDQLTGLKFDRLVLRIPISVDQNEILKGAQQAAAALGEGIQFVSGKAVSYGEELRKALNDTLTSSVANGLGSMAAAIGDAIGKGNIDGVLKAFVNTISSFLTQMGTVLIAQGISIEAFKTSLESFQGAPAIIAGIALVAAAAAFRNLAAGGLDSFATGGTIYGATPVIAGDNSDGFKEHILSDLQLQKIAREAGIGGEGGTLRTELDGTKIAIILQRSGYKLSRTN